MLLLLHIKLINKVGLECIGWIRLKSDLDDVWCWSEDELESLWVQEKQIRASLPERNRSVLYGRLSIVYLRYVVVSRQLDICYQNMVHIQKRRDIYCLIKAVCGRIIELKVHSIQPLLSLIIVMFMLCKLMIGDVIKLIIQ